MSWETLGGAPRHRTADEPVTVATSAGTGRLRPKLYIALRLPLLPALPFLQRGATCDVLFGRGENAGRLRIVAGRTSMVSATARGAATTTTALIHLTCPNGIKPAKRPPEPVAFTHDADWFEITLPDWAIAVERVTTPAPPAGRVSIMDRIPDPATALRGRAGR